MQVEAIYHEGKLEFVQPIKFIRERFAVKVEIPDEEVMTPSVGLVVDHQKNDIGVQLDTIIGREFRQANRGMKSVNAKALWHEHLEEKYLGR